mmetsp:Transcript_12842/g.26582  ORF Transcript_12842/g.26582 Transcript_12842/m.26582 type:complete len:175 (+) Transcript_12842:386-910(+)
MFRPLSAQFHRLALLGCMQLFFRLQSSLLVATAALGRALARAQEAKQWPKNNIERPVAETTAGYRQHDSDTNRERIGGPIPNAGRIQKGRKDGKESKGSRYQQSIKIGAIPRAPLPKLHVPRNALAKDVAVVIVVGTAPLANGAVKMRDAGFSPQKALGAIDSLVGTPQIMIEA